MPDSTVNGVLSPYARGDVAAHGPMHTFKALLAQATRGLPDRPRVGMYSDVGCPVVIEAVPSGPRTKPRLVITGPGLDIDGGALRKAVLDAIMEDDPDGYVTAGGKDGSLIVTHADWM